MPATATITGTVTSHTVRDCRFGTEVVVTLDTTDGEVTVCGLLSPIDGITITGSDHDAQVGQIITASGTLRRDGTVAIRPSRDDAGVLHYWTA
jgi:hypothetical protein